MAKMNKSQSAEMVWSSDQSKAYPLAGMKTSRYRCGYIYSPSDESQECGEMSQDYLALSVDGNLCRFVLCDGVSLSYRGDFAAKYLGDRLLQWLEDTSRLSGNLLADYLEEIVPQASTEIDQLELPQDMPSLLKEVLEEKRLRGAETMYLCGRIELPEPGRPQGRVWLAWHGDIRLRVWKENQELAIDTTQFLTQERWSGRVGMLGGSPHVYEQALGKDEKECRIMLYTDGLKDLDNYEKLPEILRRLNHIKDQNLEDDASWLHVSWHE